MSCSFCRDAGGTEATGAASGRIDGFHFDWSAAGDWREDELGDAVAGRDMEGGVAEIREDHADFASIAGIDGTGRIQDGHAEFERQTGTRADLPLPAIRQRDDQAGMHEGAAARRDLGFFARAQIHSGVARMRVPRDYRLRMNPLEIYVHGSILPFRPHPSIQIFLLKGQTI